MYALVVADSRLRRIPMPFGAAAPARRPHLKLVKPDKPGRPEDDIFELLPVPIIGRDKKAQPRRFAWERAVLTSTVPGVAQAVALMLSSFANKDGSSCRPSMRMLADRMGRARQHIQRAMRDLEEAGVIRWSREKSSRGVKTWLLVGWWDVGGWRPEHRLFRPAEEMGRGGGDS